GVAGWVRNRADGAVELEAEGPPESVAALLDWCRTGPPAASITSVEVTDVPVQGERTFAIVR
ncbi:MAG: acylphosphatase, partial [Calditrichaeota bacterium]|nr:acylphosphatase [Calditrichota bacterium]